MKRAIILVTALVCCGGLGCDSTTTAKLILTVGLNLRHVAQTSESTPTSQPAELPIERQTLVAELVAAMRALDERLSTSVAAAEPRSPSLSTAIERITQAATVIEQQLPDSATITRQAREAQAISFERAAERGGGEFSERLANFSVASFGREWDRTAFEKEAINRLVTDYLVAPALPADAPDVLALHAATFPNHPMNVDLYTTIAQRLVGEGELQDGLSVARAGLQVCGQHPNVNRLHECLKQFYLEYRGHIGVPMDFAGPTIHTSRFALNSLHGKPVLVVFWSTLDFVSDEFMVRCNQLANDHNATGLKVVGVNINATVDDLQSWHSKHGFSCPNIYSEEPAHVDFKNPITQFYNVKSVPTFFLLDRAGVVVARGTGDLEHIARELSALGAPRLAQAR